MQKNPTNQPAGAAPAIDVNSIIARARAGVPAQLQPIYDKAVLSGMRIMFDSKSHQMMTAALDKPGDLGVNMSEGIIQLMYLLWTQSNKTLPPQIIVPVTLTLTLKAFDFLQQSGDPRATKAVLGEATQQAVQGIMDRFGATQDKLPALLKGQGGTQPAAAPGAPGAPAAGAPAPAARGTGMLDAMGGA